MRVFLLSALVIAALVALLIVPPCQSIESSCLFEQAYRFQTLIAGIVGFGGLVAAALYNGREEREKEKRARDFYARNLAHAFVLESSELGIECGHIALSATEVSAALECPQARKGDTLAVFEDKFRAAAQPQDTLLEEISPAELSRLGFNAYGFARLTRLSLRKARRRASEGPIAQPSKEVAQAWLQEISHRYLECAVNCGRLSELMAVVANEGVEAANKVDPPSTATDKDVEKELQHYQTLRKGAATRK